MSDSLISQWQPTVEKKADQHQYGYGLWEEMQFRSEVGEMTVKK